MCFEKRVNYRKQFKIIYKKKKNIIVISINFLETLLKKGLNSKQKITV